MTTPASPTPPTPNTPKDPRRFQQAQKLLLLAADILSQVQGKKIMDARRRRAAQLASAGLLITLATLAADFFGLLRGVENFFYDQRAYYFQYNLRRPSESIVHLDIDEGAILTMGRWPWSRRFQARVIDEIGKAEPRVLFLDIVYSEDSKTSIGNREVVDPESDEVFARAIKSAKVVLAPLTVGLKGDTGFSEIHRKIVTALMERPQSPATMPSGSPSTTPSTAPAAEPQPTLSLTPVEIARKLGELNDDRPTDAFSQAFLAARERAVELRVLAVVQENPNAKLMDVRNAILGAGNRRISVIDDTIELQFRLLTQRRAIERFTRPLPQGLPELLRPNQIQAPIAVIGEAAAFSGFVDYVESQDGDSKVRFVPLWVNINGRMLPHVSMAMFCAFRGVPLSDVRFEPGKVIVPGPPGVPDTVIPVRTLRRPGKEDAPLVADIPWFGERQWETMYDVPSHMARRQRVSLTAVENILDTENRIQINLDDMKRLTVQMLDAFSVPLEIDSSMIESAKGIDVTPDTVEDLKGLITGIREVYFLPRIDALRAMGMRAPAETAELNTLDRFEAKITEYNSLLVDLLEQRAKIRADLRRQLGGKIVLVGMTGTGTMDFYPTSIHSVAPGVVAHGALVNGLLTGELWTRAPAWVTYVLTLLAGIVTTLVVAFASPWKASLGAVAAIGTYTFLNGFVLFDTYDIVVGVAGPMTAIGATWAGVTLLRFIAEIVERNRITARFRSYVDPELVNYVAENPDQASFTGRKQIMTVVFTDLEGFTTLSEKLGEGIVGTLNDYVGAMTPIIRGNRGFIDKFLGDGIMFEFNAVIPNNHHAIDAVTAVLQMQDAMGPFNKNLDERNLPTLKMRVGVNTGPMIFGDAGGAGANNITVLGDAVNLAARLEGANKPFGSAIMVTQETLDQCEGKFTVRPIANIRVKGKENAVVVYEPLCFAGQETPEQIKLIELTTKVFKLYSAAKFEECMTACDEMNSALGGHVKFADTYHKACIHLLAEGAGPDFDGSISLSEK